MNGTINKGSLVKGGGSGSGGGGSAIFPTTVTSSGSSLPVDLSDFECRDTFLNTTDKKIYTTTTDTYELNDNVYRRHSGYTNDVEVDNVTGVATNFAITSVNGNGYYRTLLRSQLSTDTYGWKGEKNYKIHFKTPSTISSDSYRKILMVIVSGSTSSSYGTYYYTIIYLKNKKLYFALGRKAYSSTLTLDEEDILAFDYEFVTDKEYFLDIQKKNNGTVLSVLHENSYDGNVLAQATSEVADNYGNYSSTSIYYNSLDIVGYLTKASQSATFSNVGGSVYLLDSTGDFLKASSVLNWDSGTDITEGQYLDTTNGILYFYKDDILTGVGGA